MIQNLPRYQYHYALSNVPLFPRYENDTPWNSDLSARCMFALVRNNARRLLQRIFALAPPQNFSLGSSSCRPFACSAHWFTHQTVKQLHATTITSIRILTSHPAAYYSGKFYHARHNGSHYHIFLLNLEETPTPRLYIWCNLILALLSHRLWYVLRKKALTNNCCRSLSKLRLNSRNIYPINHLPTVATILNRRADVRIELCIYPEPTTRSSLTLPSL